MLSFRLIILSGFAIYMFPAVYETFLVVFHPRRIAFHSGHAVSHLLWTLSYPRRFVYHLSQLTLITVTVSDPWMVFFLSMSPRDSFICSPKYNGLQIE